MTPSSARKVCGPRPLPGRGPAAATVSPPAPPIGPRLIMRPMGSSKRVLFFRQNTLSKGPATRTLKEKPRPKTGAQWRYIGERSV